MENFCFFFMFWLVFALTYTHLTTFLDGTLDETQLRYTLCSTFLRQFFYSLRFKKNWEAQALYCIMSVMVNGNDPVYSSTNHWICSFSLFLFICRINSAYHSSIIAVFGAPLTYLHKFHHFFCIREYLK